MEVLGLYSNLRDQGERLQVLLDLTPDGAGGAPKPKQVQRRLRPHEIAELVVAYQSGATLQELAGRYRVRRDTVSLLLERAGVPRRYRRLNPADVEGAVRLYRSGQSLATIGKQLRVEPSTVRDYLVRTMVVMRDCHGREP